MEQHENSPTATREPPPGEEEASQATPVDVVATRRGGHSVSLQTSEHGGAAAPQGSDAELRKQLRESQIALKATINEPLELPLYTPLRTPWRQSNEGTNCCSRRKTSLL